MAVPNNPITREEKYLASMAGQEVDLPQPITRVEKYLAKASGMDVETPDPITREERYLDAIAEGGGSSVTVEPLIVTANGTTTAPSGKAYSPVTANVPNSYGASDEGKVVNNGALVAQTAHAPVTANGTIDTTLNNSVTVDVEGGGTISDVIFDNAPKITYNQMTPEEYEYTIALGSGYTYAVAWIVIYDGTTPICIAESVRGTTSNVSTNPNIVAYFTVSSGDVASLLCDLSSTTAPSAVIYKGQ